MDPIPIRNSFPNAGCFLVPVTDTTMEEARRMAAAGFPAGTVVAADRQTASRGRFRDRTWESEPGRDLTFTVILPGDVGSLPGLPLRAGLALCRTIETYVRELRLEIREELRIKWPNDLLSGGRKLAGILCESSPGFCYLGVGVNCGKPENASFRTPASGLSEELGAPVDRFRLLELFLERLARVVKEDDWRAEVTRRLWLQGVRVRFRTGFSDPGLPGVGTVDGTVHSIGPSGELVLDTGGCLVSLVSGELTLL